LDVIKESAVQVLKQVSTVPGVARAFVDRLGELPQIQVHVDRARAARYGINVADVQDVIESALGGKAVTQVWEGEQRFAVAVRLEEEERRLTRMQDLLIATPNGAYVPLSDVAAFRTVGGLMNIARENGKRVFAIGVFIRGRDMGGVVSDMQARVQDNIKLPEGVSITWSGEFENQERAMARLAVIVPISILIIFLLLFNAFKSFASALVIIANIPFSIIGGILALWITGIYLSVSAAIGFIALFGQSVLNGVVMVALFNDQRQHGKSAEVAVATGALMRLRTVLMTALLPSFGLLPMALSHGIGAETQRPLAVGLPGIDGFEVLRWLRGAEYLAPVLVLTARDTVNDRVHGLDLGADDYMAKPFAMPELAARVRALIRRSQAQIGPKVVHGPLILDTVARRAYLQNEPLELAAREWAVLEVLLGKVETIVSKESIIQAVAGWDEDLSPNAIEVYISRLRTKLARGGGHIRPVRGFGYMLEART